MENQQDNKPVYVIGAGISGLGCAHYLKKEGVSSVILESGETIGGRAGYVEVDGNCFEIGGKNFSSNWPLSSALLSEFGLTDYEPQHVSLHIMVDGKVIEFTKTPKFPDSLPMLRALGVKGAAQLYSYRNFVKEKQNEIAYTSPLIEKIEDDYDDVALTEHFAPELSDSLFRTMTIVMGGAEPEEMYYSNLTNLMKNVAGNAEQYALKGGIKKLYDKFQEDHEIRYNTPIEKIVIEDGAVSHIVAKVNGRRKKIPTDHVVAAVPLPVLAELIDFPEDVTEVLAFIQYNPVALINVQYDQDVFDDKVNSIMFDRDSHLGHCSANRVSTKNAVRFTIAGAKGREIINLSDEELLEVVEKEFSAVRPLRGKRLRYHVQRHPIGLCSYGPYFSRIKQIIMNYVASVEGLEIAGDYLEGHSMEYCLSSAKKAVERML